MKNWKLAFVLPISALLIGCDPETQYINLIVEVPPPEPVSTPLLVDVQASQVDGDFFLNGGSFSQSVYQSGDLFLRDQGTGSMVELGNTYDDGYDVMLVDSTYDSIYRHFTGGAVPVNDLGVVQLDIGIAGDTSVNVDVPMVSVRPQFLLDSSNFPASVYNSATFYLQPVDSEELIFLGQSHVTNDSVNIIPGDYHVIYGHQQGALVPANTHARVISGLTIDVDTFLVVDVPSVDVRTSFSHNGAAFPQSQYVRAEFYLVDDLGDEVFLGNSYDAADTINVIGGTYDIEYRHQQGDTIPLNQQTVVRSSVDLSSGGDASVNVLSFSLDISPTLNGQPFQVSEYQDAILELRDRVNGSYSLLGNTHNPFANLVVIPGNYDIVYSHETGDAVPQNIRGTVLADYAIVGDQQLNLDITGHNLTTSLTLDTASFPLSQYNYADILLSGDASSEDILLSTTLSQDEPAMVLAGVYDLIYSCHNCIDIPFNNYATIVDGFNVTMTDVIAANISSVRVETTATLNGEAFPQSAYQNGLIWAGMQEGDAVELTATRMTTDDVILIAGDYTFYYQHLDGDQVPANIWAIVDQQSVLAPPN